MTPKVDNKFKQVLSHQHAYSKGIITKKFLKNRLEWNLITKKIQKTTPTHLDQHTEG